jgi:UDP-N-acetylmuramoylalanine--D-glutamate ligase
LLHFLEKKGEGQLFAPKNKRRKVLIMGLGLHGGGAGAARFFAKRGWRVLVTDLKRADELAPSIKALRKFSSIRYVFGRHRKKDFLEADLIIKGAGIAWDDPILRLARAKKIPVESDVGIFFELCPSPIIGITGSKGKSTTASLIFGMMRKKYRNVFLAGNIRKSVLDILPRITKKSFVVLELSSWQLEDAARHKKSPHIAVITNVLREHLNRYRNFAAYVRAKSMIVRFQKKDDWLIVPKHDRIARRISQSASSRVYFFEKPPFHTANPVLRGVHNEANIAAASATAKLLGISAALQKKAICQFRGLEGRLQYVATKRGVRYYNDTTATMPDAAIAALHAISRGTTTQYAGGIILIAGGADKKLDFRNFAKEIVKNVQTAVWLPGNATENLKSKILNLKSKKQPKQYDAKTMEEAVRKAARLARAGDIVLLSPGAASFGLFQNEFERGAEFVRWVRKIKSEK